MWLIPAIDLRAGRCVRLYQGDFAAETRYDVEPHELLLRYRDLGADWLHVVDLDGARDGSQANRATIASLASQPAVRLQVGGGLRDDAAIDQLLRAGVGRAVVGSMAVTSQAVTRRWLHRFGGEALVLAFDVRLDETGVPLCATQGWREQSALSLWAAVERYAADGLRHVLCTDIARDGAMRGPNLALYRQAVRRFPEICWQASGGVSGAADLQALAATGVAAAISGRALLDERIAPQELEPFLPNA
jgi:phosphoribosylformimino-5-aminoimidazole carboxamide ribotide isomerase